MNDIEKIWSTGIYESWKNKKDEAEHDACLSLVLGSTTENIARTGDFAMELKATKANSNFANLQ